jgi:hypothetical protein
MVLALISAIPIAIRFMVQPFLYLPVLPWQGLIENTARRPSFHPARNLSSPEKGSPKLSSRPGVEPRRLDGSLDLERAM